MIIPCKARTFQFLSPYKCATFLWTPRRFTALYALPARNFCAEQDIFSQEYWRISRKNDAAQREKARCPGALAVFRYTPGNSIDEIAACRGSNRAWTSAFPYSSGFLAAAPFFRGQFSGDGVCSALHTVYEPIWIPHPSPRRHRSEEGPWSGEVKKREKHHYAKEAMSIIWKTAYWKQKKNGTRYWQCGSFPLWYW